MAANNSNVVANLGIEIEALLKNDSLSHVVKHFRAMIKRLSKKDNNVQLGIEFDERRLKDAKRAYSKLISEMRKQARGEGLLGRGNNKARFGSLSQGIAGTQELNKLQKSYKSILKEISKIDEELNQIASNKATAKQIAATERQTQSFRRQTLELERQLNTTNKLGKSFGQLGNMLKQYFSIYAIKSYAQNLVKITAEFDMQRRALGSLIGDQAKSIEIFNQLKSMALESPYTALELNKAAKQLAAYSIETKDLVKTTKMLGDVASATGTQIDRLILAYGQVKTAHFLRGQEVRQFTEAGVPLLEALASRFTVAEGKTVTAEQVQQRITNRGVRFEDVQAALQSMTSEGGRFYNFQEQIAETTYGKIQKFQDALQQGWERLGTDAEGLFNKILDTGINIAKNLSGYVKTLGVALSLWGVWNAKRKISLAIAEKEAMTIEKELRFTTLQKNYASLGDTQRAAFYGKLSSKEGEKAKEIIELRNQWRSVGKEIRTATISAKGFNKVIAFGNAAVKGLVTGCKLLKITLAEIFTQTVIGAAIILIGTLVSKIWAASDAMKQLEKDLANIDMETLKKNNEAEKGFNRLAQTAINAAKGSNEQTKALQDLAQTYGDIIPLEQLSIENLKSLKGNYKQLTDQVKIFNQIQATEEKKRVLGSEEKTLEAFKDIRFNYKSQGKSEEINTFRNTADEIRKQLQSELSSGLITSNTELQARAKELGKELGGDFSEEFSKNISVILTKGIQEYFDKIKSLNKEQIKLYNTFYGGDKNRQNVQNYEKDNERQKKYINNAKSVEELLIRHNEEYNLAGRYLDKILTTEQLSQLSEQDKQDILLGNVNISEKISGLTDGQINSTNAIAKNLRDILGNVNLLDSRNVHLLELYKGEAIEVQKIRDYFYQIGETEGEHFNTTKKRHDTAGANLDNLINNYTDEKLRTEYGVTRSQVEKIRKSKKWNSSLFEDISNIELGNWATDYLDYYAEGYKDIPDKKGKGESRFAKAQRELAEWIAMMDKAHKDFENLDDYFFKQTALDKVTDAYKSQFDAYKSQFKEITGMNNLADWIGTDEDFNTGLLKFKNYVDKLWKEATDPKDKKLLEKFAADIMQKISDNNIRKIKENIDKYIKEMERQLDNTKNRINLFEKIVSMTENSYMAQNFAETFYGQGSMSAIGYMKNSFAKVVRDISGALGDEAGASFYKEMINTLEQSGTFDWQAFEKMFDKLEPSETKSKLLKVFQEFKSANEKILEEALNSYKKNQTIEEKRVTAHAEMLRKIANLDNSSLDEYAKKMGKDNVLKGYRQQMVDLELEAIKSSKIYIDLFANIEHAGVASLTILKEQLITLRDTAKDLTASELKKINEEIKKIDKYLQPQRNISDIFRIPSKKEILDAMHEIDKLERDMSNLRLLQQNNNEWIAYNSSQKDKAQATLERGVQGIDNPISNVLNQSLQEYNENLKAGAIKQEELTKQQEILNEQYEKASQTLIELESLRSKAIEYLQQQITKAFSTGIAANGLASSIVQELQNARSFRTGLDASKSSKDYENILSALSQTQSFFDGYKSIFDNALKLWSDISGKIAQSNGTAAAKEFQRQQNNKTSEGRLTNAMDDNTMAIKELTAAIKGETLSSVNDENTIEQKGGWSSMSSNDKLLTGIGIGTQGVGAVAGFATGDVAGGLAGVSGMLSMAGPYGQMAAAAIQMGTAIYDAAVKIHDSRIQDEIDDLGDKIKELDKTMTAIENRMNKSAGNQYFQGMKEQMNTYLKQAQLAEKQAEKAKQKKRADSDEIESYVEKAEQLRQQAIQKQEEMFQYLLGSDIKGYLENIVSVFTQAKQAGENTFAALKKSFGEMVSSMVQKMIMTTIIKTKFQKLFDQITEMVNRGGMGTSDVDKMIATGLQATQEANNALNAMYPVIQRINTAFGVTASTAGSLSTGVKGMTEETAASMSGYLMANFDRLGEIQKSVYAIQLSVAGNTASGMMTQYQNDTIAHLAQIEANTLKSANKASDLYDLLIGMRVVNNTGSGAVYALQVLQE